MTGPVFLQGEAVTLRPVEREDVAFLRRAMNDARVWRPALDVDPMNAEQATAFFENTILDSADVHCLACDGEEPLGVLSLSSSMCGPDGTARFRAAELAYRFAPEHRGQGFGSDAAARMVQYAFEDRNLRRLGARVGSFNDASIGLLESLGFAHEGTLRQAAWYRGEYHDMLRYGLLRENWSGR